MPSHPPPSPSPRGQEATIEAIQRRTSLDAEGMTSAIGVIAQSRTSARPRLDSAHPRLNSDRSDRWCADTNSRSVRNSHAKLRPVSSRRESRLRPASPLWTVPHTSSRGRDVQIDDRHARGSPEVKAIAELVGAAVMDHHSPIPTFTSAPTFTLRHRECRCRGQLLLARSPQHHPESLTLPCRPHRLARCDVLPDRSRPTA